jgi:hypothetical protein
MERDDGSNREYKLMLRVISDSPYDGPATVLQTPGLPTWGAIWAVDDDLDEWAWCRWNASIKPVITGEPNYQWDCEFTFSTKPPDLKYCKDSQIEDPLLIPPRVSGNFSKEKEEAVYDRFGKRIKNSAFEQIRGAKVEFDKNNWAVKIEMNVALLDLSLITSMKDCVNKYPMWDLPPRTIKFATFSWERKFYGLCYVYYVVNYEFEIRFDPDNKKGTVSGWDKDLMDEGHKVLNGHWGVKTRLLPGSTTDFERQDQWYIDDIGDGIKAIPSNPRHFIEFIDRQGNKGSVILKNGKPAGALVQGATTFITQEGYNPVVGNTFLPILNQPPLPTDPTSPYSASGGLPLEIIFQDPNMITTDGFVLIKGLDEKGVPATEGLVLADNTTGVPMSNAPLDWETETLFSHVDSIEVVGFDFEGVATLPVLWVQTPYRFEDAGNIHVEKYDEADFTLLGIPLDF